jgi:hypothetical protein
MFRILGVIFGFGAVYALISGAIIAYNKAAIDSADMMLIGMALMVVSQLFIKAGEHVTGEDNGNNSREKS